MQGAIFGVNVDDIKCEYLSGAYSELSQIVGTEAVIKIHSLYRGQQVSFPVNLFSKDFISSQIIMEHKKGTSIKHIATKYGYSEKWVRKILKQNNDTSKGRI